MEKKKLRNVILIIDDDKLFCDAVSEHLEEQGIEVLAVHKGSDGIEMLEKQRIDVVLLDQRLPDVEGHTLCTKILHQNEEIKIIFITAHPSFEGAIQAIRAGAHDYLSKPFEMEELMLAVERTLKMLNYEKMARFDEYRRNKETAKTVLIGSHGLREVRRLVDLAASEDASVLITGETGTGKNMVAKAIHLRGPNSKKPFVSINCAALPDNLVEAELFGYAKGSFTGATTDKRGIFEMAEGGTLFLDEIGEMPIHLQTKLLGVLEDKRVRRVGGESFMQVDVRVLAATGKNLEEVLGKTFRTDLYYRLSVIHIHLPSLKQRRQDIPELCEHLLKVVGAARDRIEIDQTEKQKLMQYDWPGNVRELKNILERAAILGKDSHIMPSELIERSFRNSTPNLIDDEDQANIAPSEEKGVLSLEDFEKRHIMFALDQYANNYTQAANALGIARCTLKRKLKSYRIR